MTIVDDDVRLGEALADTAKRGVPAPPPPPVDEPDEELDGADLLSATSLSVAGLLSSAAAGIACAGVFTGFLPRVAAVAAAAIGAGMMWASTRVRRPSTVQLLIPVVAVVAGALLVLPDATGGSANLPGLVAEALREGGIGQPPVAFDPGWRFLLVVGMVMLGASAAGLAIGLNRAKVAVFLPLPVLFGGLSAQPAGGGTVPTLVALALVVAALTVSFGAELGREGATGRGFELRRLAKGGVAMLGLVAVLGAVTQVGALFPDPDDDDVVPPKRPSPTPPEPDRELFTAQSDRRLPWRVGVLDGYDGEAWLTPPFDTRRFVDADGPQVPRVAPGTVQEGETESVRVTFTVSDVRGHVVPTPPNPSRVDSGRTNVEFDPRTQTLRLPDARPAKGMKYTVEAPNPPHAADLVNAPRPSPAMQEYLEAPEPPAEVVDLLNQAPGADDFTRLQFMRQKFYEVVTAKGSGQPTPVPPERVGELLAGQPGTPFEITAAEALLARWTGIPSRIGFGYVGGDEKDGVLSVRPRHAGTWLEVHFEGFGWVSILGTPPRAQASLDSSQRNANAAIRPSDNLTLPAYVPVRVPTAQLIYVVVQYWVARTVPYLMAAGLVVWLYPGALKAVRRWRRRRWARAGEPADRIRIAYAEFRDAASDSNIGSTTLTPLELVELFEPDVEHRELAWLVTRALWGDLSRDLQEDDIEAAEEMSRSVTARMRAVQPATARVMAFASRASLKNPYSDDMPNMWWQRPKLSLPRMPSWRRRPVPATAALVLLLALFSGGCVQDIDVMRSSSASLPDALVPDRIGDVTFTRESSAEEVFASAGPERLVGDVAVFSVRKGEDVVGAVQVAAFKTSLADRESEVRAGIVNALSSGRMGLVRLGRDAVYREQMSDRQLYLWFAPEGGYYEVFVARNDFETAGEVFANVLAFQRGEDVNQQVRPPADPRRGFEG